MITSWAKLLKDACEETGDDFAILQATLSLEGWTKEFDDGFGSAKGKPFTAWGEKYVYFPVVYDGKEWVGFAPRNPCDIATSHMGDE